MKTTIEIPDPLYRRVKLKAAAEGITVKEILIDALIDALDPSRPYQVGADRVREGGSGGLKHSEVDAAGWPVLRRAGKGAGESLISDDFVNELREEEGV